MRKTYEVTENIQLNIDADTCYRLLCDFESYPRWLKNVIEARVLEHDENSVPVSAYYLFNLAIKKEFKIIQRYSYDREKKILYFTSEGGHFKDAAGHMQCKKLPTGRTELKYFLKFNPGVILPPKIINFLIDRVLQEFLADIKNEAEKIPVSSEKI